MLLQSESCLWRPSFLAVDLRLTQEPPVTFALPLWLSSFTLQSPWAQEIVWERGCPETSTTGDYTLFQKLTWLYLKPNGGDVQETYGALDLGGASTQITFVPQDKNIESPNNALHFRLYGKDYSVYTHSFLCYGKDQALRQKLAKDIQASVTESRPTHLTCGLPDPHPVVFFISVIGLNLDTVLSKPLQAVYLNYIWSTSVNCSIQTSPPMFVYCIISKDMTQILSWELSYPWIVGLIEITC